MALAEWLIFQGPQYRQAMAKDGLKIVPLEVLTDLLSAAFDRAALAIAEGRPATSYIEAIRLILTSVTRAQDF